MPLTPSFVFDWISAGGGVQVERTMRFGLPGSEELSEQQQSNEGATFYKKDLSAAKL